MVWRIEFTDAARRDLGKLDPTIAKRILTYLVSRVAQADDPLSLGSGLKGNEFAGLWHYRVGDYRILTRIERNIVTVFVIEIGHRREIYR